MYCVFRRGCGGRVGHYTRVTYVMALTSIGTLITCGTVSNNNSHTYIMNYLMSVINDSIFHYI